VQVESHDAEGCHRESSARGNICRGGEDHSERQVVPQDVVVVAPPGLPGSHPDDDGNGAEAIPDPARAAAAVTSALPRRSCLEAFAREPPGEQVK